MMLQLNGKDVKWEKDTGTIQDLLASYQLENKIVIVERNKEIIGKERYHEVELCAFVLWRLISSTGFMIRQTQLRLRYQQKR